MRNEFLYFYPLDSRHSAHELIPNHLTFMIFNHTAIFPENLWPRQIVTNGHVLMEGAKMSKSFGNIIPLREGLEKFGADPIRLSVLGTAELLQDADFSPSVARAMRERLERMHKFVAAFTKEGREQRKIHLSALDKWMLSRLQWHIKRTTEAMEKLAVRKAMQTILYDLDQDLQWYQRRMTETSKSAVSHVINEILNTQIRMLAPVAPHICEELWEMLGGENFVSMTSWPTPEESKIDFEAEEKETLVMKVLEDTLNIIKATGITPKKVCYYTAAQWKWQIYQKALQKSINAKISQKDLMKEMMDNAELKTRAEKVAKFLSQILDEVNHMPEERKQRLMQIGKIDEHQTLKDAEKFFKKELKAEIFIYAEEEPGCYDPKKRAQLAKPFKPAIYIE